MRCTTKLFLVLLTGCSSAPPQPLSTTRGAEAKAQWQQGHLAAAELGYAEALEQDRYRVDLPAAIKHQNNLAVLALFDDRLDEARAHLLAALDLCAVDLGAVDGAPDLTSRLRLQLASCHLRNNDLMAAEKELASLAAWAERAAAADRVPYRLLRAGLLLRRGDATAASAEALAVANAAENAEQRAAALVLSAKATAAAPERARSTFQQALGDAREAGHLPMVIECLLGIAHSYESEDRAAALRYCRLALAAARARNYASMLPRIEQEIARIEQ